MANKTIRSVSLDPDIDDWLLEQSTVQQRSVSWLLNEAARAARDGTPRGAAPAEGGPEVVPPATGTTDTASPERPVVNLLKARHQK